MKIAVATNNQRTVTGHIGRCRSFMIFEINGNDIISKEVRASTFTHHRKDGGHHHHHEEGEHHHGDLVRGLKDCSYLISNGGGWRMVEELKKENINTIFTERDEIDTIVQKFIKGELVHNAELSCSGHSN